MNSVAHRGRRAAFRHGRLLTWLASGALIIVFASHVALPPGLSFHVPQLAARHGQRLDVERVRAEPFESRLLLCGVRPGTARGSSIEWSGIEAQVDLVALFCARFGLNSLRAQTALEAARALPEAE